MSGASDFRIPIDDRLRAALLWDRPALHRPDDLGCSQWRQALSFQVHRFGDVDHGDLVSVAAHAINRITRGDAGEAAQLLAELRAVGPEGSLVEIFISLALRPEDAPAADHAPRDALPLVRRLEDADLRARLALRLATFAHERGDDETGRAALDVAVADTSTETRLGVVVRRLARWRGVDVPDFEAFASTATPDDPLLSLPWVRDEALVAAAELATKRFEEDLSGLWDTTFSVGRTKLDDLLAAHLQAEWCGATDLRKSIRQLLSTHLLSGAARSPEETRWALLIWATTSQKRVSAAIRRAELTLDAAAASALLRAVQEDPTVAFDTVVQVAHGVWDLLDDRDCDAVLRWLIERCQDATSGGPVSTLLANLRWRRPMTWHAVFASADNDARACMLAALGPEDVEDMAEPTRRVVADYAAEHTTALPQDLIAALSLATAVDEPFADESTVDSAATLAVLEWRADAVQPLHLRATVDRLLDGVVARLAEARTGKFAIGGETCEALGRVAAHLPRRDDRVVNALLDHLRDDAVPARWQLGALEGLGAMRRADLLSSQDLTAIRGAKLRPGPGLFGESLTADALRAAQLRVLAPDLSESDVTWLAICARGTDRQARVIAVVAFADAGDTAPSTVDWSLTGALFDPDDDVVVRAVGVLGRRGLPADAGAAAVARHRLEELAVAGSARVRREVVTTARKRSELELEHVVERARSDRAWSVRRAAAT